MEKDLKAQVVQAAEAVKKKVKELRTMESYNEKMLDTVFQPITKPLHQMIHDTKNSKTSNEFTDSSFTAKDNYGFNESVGKNFKDIKSSFDPQDEISDEDINENSFEDSNKSNTSNSSFRTIESMQSPSQDTSSWSLSSEMFEDVPFGVRKERGKLFMGSSRVTVQNEKISIAGHVYKKTPGLCELLFKKVPDLDLVTGEDGQIYKEMLIETNAHRRDYDPNKPIKTNRGRKYLHIIKPLFKLRKPSTSSVSSAISNVDHVSEGEGLMLNKKLKKYTDFIYWDDPNELVERLKLLIASKNAGNTGVDNEIISIIEELREKKLIN